jgi:1-acyl-sn-glycerol-3-phosphate acyltransferase
MKRELMRIPLFGWHCAKMGVVVVHREGQANAMRKLISDARQRLQEPRQLLIFPEGTRKAPGDPPDYKPGVAGIYRDLGLPCALVATNTGDHLDVNGLPTSPGVVVYEVVTSLPAGLKRADFMRSLQDKIEAASAAL